jgi:hypothetical protein
MPLTEFYGYIIDLAFRTNAANSNLLLQTAPKDRIYTNNTNEATMGHGSTMTFTKTDSDYTVEQMKALMGELRVVFFGTDGTIYAKAKLNIAEAVTTGIEVTAALNLYVEATECTYIDGENNTQKVYLYDGKYYTNNTLETEASIPANVTPTAGETKIEVLITDQDKAVIKSLALNATERVSVLVYLDGTNIGNDDVAAKAAQSMTGTMNLQFSSSAKLIPMDYADLHTPGKNAGEGTENP